MRADRRTLTVVADCGAYSEELTASLDSATELSRSATRHIESCLRCQADLVQYRKVLRALRSMRTDYLEPAPGLLPDILASLEEAGERHAIRAALHDRRVAYIGGIAAAATAAGAGALVIATRRSRMKLVG